MTHRIEVPLVPECSACIIHSLGTLIPLLTDNENERFRLFALAYSRLAAGFHKKTDPATLSIELYRELYEISGVKDPYSELKAQSVEAAKKALPVVEKIVLGFSGYEKLRAALAASIAGNVIDFNTAGHEANLSELEGTFTQVMDQGFDLDDSRHLWQTLVARHGNLLFIADNAGEKLFDIPLLRLLVELGWKVTYVVKGKPMINDATEEDVRGTETEKLADISNTGAWAHGVPRQWVSREFLEKVDSSDLVLSKGQANIETFPEIQRETKVETYYILKGKCPHISQAIGAKKGDNIVLRRPIIDE